MSRFKAGQVWRTRRGDYAYIKDMGGPGSERMNVVVLGSDGNYWVKKLHSQTGQVFKIGYAHHFDLIERLPKGVVKEIDLSIDDWGPAYLVKGGTDVPTALYVMGSAIPIKGLKTIHKEVSSILRRGK